MSVLFAISHVALFLRNILLFYRYFFTTSAGFAVIGADTGAGVAEGAGGITTFGFNLLSTSFNVPMKSISSGTS
jgi:hypothetical protein